MTNVQAFRRGVLAAIDLLSPKAQKQLAEDFRQRHPNQCIIDGSPVDLAVTEALKGMAQGLCDVEVSAFYRAKE